MAENELKWYDISVVLLEPFKALLTLSPIFLHWWVIQLYAMVVQQESMIHHKETENRERQLRVVELVSNVVFVIEHITQGHPTTVSVKYLIGEAKIA